MQIGVFLQGDLPTSGTTEELKNADSRPHSSRAAALKSFPPLTSNQHTPPVNSVLGFSGSLSLYTFYLGKLIHLMAPVTLCGSLGLYTSLLRESYTSLTKLSVPLHLAVSQCFQLSVPKARLKHLSYPNISLVSPPQKVPLPCVQVHHSCLLFLPHHFCLCMEASLSLLNAPFPCYFYSRDVSIWFSTQHFLSFRLHLPTWLLHSYSRLLCKGTCISTPSLRPWSRARLFVNLFFDTVSKALKVTAESP